MIWTTLPRSRLNNEFCGWQGGTGPQLLLIHGVGMRADYWSNLIPELQNHFSLTIIDLPGHGDSAHLVDDNPSLPRYTDSVARLIQDSHTMVVGHSMGALIAIDLAIRYPDHVTAIVAMNAPYQRSDTAKAAVQSRANSIAGDEALNFDATVERWFDSDATGISAAAKNCCEQWLNQLNITGYGQAYSAFAHHDGPNKTELETIRCPALFMTGGDEPNSTPAMSQAMASAVGQGEFHIVSNARHMMSMTHKVDVLDRCLPFLREQASCS